MSLFLFYVDAQLTLEGWETADQGHQQDKAEDEKLSDVSGDDELGK